MVDTCVSQMVSSIITGPWFSDRGSPFCCEFTPGSSRLVLITGPNVSGKSVVRKLLHNYAVEQQWLSISLSQEGRTQSSGLERLMLYGVESADSTGYNSIRQFLRCLQRLQATQCHEKPCVVVLDEPEIGCSEETQAAIGERLAAALACPGSMPALKAIFVITHSRELVRHVMPAAPSHWRLCGDAMTLSQFVSRAVVPTDLEQLVRDGKDNWAKVGKLRQQQRRCDNNPGRSDT